MKRTSSAPLVGAQVGDLDHLLLPEVPDGDLVAEARRLDASCAQRGRPERRADAAIGLVERREVVHVPRAELPGSTLGAGAEVLPERARPVVELDDPAGQRGVVRRPDHRRDDLAVMAMPLCGAM